MKIGRVLLMPKGDYNGTAIYNNLDWVRDNGIAWVCTKDGTTGITPSDTTPEWQVLAQDGQVSGAVEWSTGVNNKPFDGVDTDGGLRVDANKLLEINADGTTVAVDSDNKVNVPPLKFDKDKDKGLALKVKADGTGYEWGKAGMDEDAEYTLSKAEMFTDYATEWESGSYLKGTTRSRNGALYTALRATSEAPSPTATDWMKVDASTITDKLSDIDGKADKSEVDKKITKPTSATKDQVLTFNGTDWVAKDSQSGGVEEPTDLETGIVGGDEYVSGKTYNPNETCIYKNKVYVCKSTTNTIPTNTTYWEETSLSVLNSKLKLINVQAYSGGYLNIGAIASDGTRTTMQCTPDGHLTYYVNDVKMWEK